MMRKGSRCRSRSFGPAGGWRVAEQAAVRAGALRDCSVADWTAAGRRGPCRFGGGGAAVRLVAAGRGISCWPPLLQQLPRCAPGWRRTPTRGSSAAALQFRRRLGRRHFGRSARISIPSRLLWAREAVPMAAAAGAGSGATPVRRRAPHLPLALVLAGRGAGSTGSGGGGVGGGSGSGGWGDAGGRRPHLHAGRGVRAAGASRQQGPAAPAGSFVLDARRWGGSSRWRRRDRRRGAGMVGRRCSGGAAARPGGIAGFCSAARRSRSSSGHERVGIGHREAPGNDRLGDLDHLRWVWRSAGCSTNSAASSTCGGRSVDSISPAPYTWISAMRSRSPSRR